ncbi:hypothetical protein AA313_de0204182 [Arthrobotrys entomopaga]|nr:hypothetical protein AA313_de0204182 [Arthrobotrys entomopaga]
MSQTPIEYCEVCRSTSHSITACRYLKPGSCRICYRNNHATDNCYYKEETDPSKIHKLTACKICHRVGHSLRNCWELQDNYSKRPPGFKRFIPGHERVGQTELDRERRSMWGVRPSSGGDSDIRILTHVTANAAAAVTEDEELTDKGGPISARADDGEKEVELLIGISDQAVAPLTTEQENRGPRRVINQPAGVSLLDLVDEEMENLQSVLPNTIPTPTPPKSPTPEIKDSPTKPVIASHTLALRGGEKEKANSPNHHTPNEDIPNHWDFRGMWTASIDYTYHISSDCNDFSELDELVEPVTVRMRNGKSLVATHCGTVPPRVLAEDRKRHLKLIDVLYIPEFEGKVMSMSKLIERGMKVRMTGEIIDFLGGGNLKARATRSGDRYVFLT